MKNEENMTKVKELMAQAKQVNLGGELKGGVDIDFTSSYKNDEGSNVKYQGTILFKRPTIQDYMKMGAVKSEYLRKAGVVNLSLVDPSIKEMAQIIATLSVLTVKCPAWFMDIEKIEDPALLFHVYDRYEEWERSFRVPDEKEPTGDSEPSEGEEALVTP
jgi:hypothetical protein